MPVDDLTSKEQWVREELRAFIRYIATVDDIRRAQAAFDAYVAAVRAALAVPPSTPTGEPPQDWVASYASLFEPTGEPDATEGPVDIDAIADDVHVAIGRLGRTPAAPTVEPPEPDEDRTKPPPSYEVYSIDEDEPPTGPPVWGWLVNRESDCSDEGWFDTAAEAVADAWRDYDKYTAPHRARAEAAERERGEARHWADEYREGYESMMRQRDEALQRCRDADEAGVRVVMERDEARATLAALSRGDLPEQLRQAKADLASLRKERTTLRALLERCEPVLQQALDDSDALRINTVTDLLTDIHTALRQSKGAEP